MSAWPSNDTLQKVDVSVFGSMKPKEVLYDFEGPCIFTFEAPSGGHRHPLQVGPRDLVPTLKLARRVLLVGLLDHWAKATKSPACGLLWVKHTLDVGEFHPHHV